MSAIGTRDLLALVADARTYRRRRGFVRKLWLWVLGGGGR